MSNEQMILVEEGEVNGDIGVGVTLTMSRERAELLFHDINRVLALLDLFLYNDRVRDMDPVEQAACDRTNAVLAQLQRELGIKPEVT